MIDANPESSQTAKVMVVDDLPMTCEAIRGMLEGDFQVETALSGERGLAAIDEFHPDLVVLDAIMPGMDGYEVCRRIKNKPDTASIKVIMISANAISEKNRESGYMAGADDYLVKPFIHQDLFSKVQVWSRIKRAEDLMKVRLNELELEKENTSRLTYLKSQAEPVVAEMIRKIQAVAADSDLLAEHLLAHYKSDIKLCAWAESAREKARFSTRLATQLFSLFQKI